MGGRFSPRLLRHEGCVHDPDLPQQELLHRTGRVPGRGGRTKPAEGRKDPEGVRIELVLAREVPRHGDTSFLVSSAQSARLREERVSQYSGCKLERKRVESSALTSPRHMNEEHILFRVGEDHGVACRFACFVSFCVFIAVGQAQRILQKQNQPVAKGDASVPYNVFLACRLRRTRFSRTKIF